MATSTVPAFKKKLFDLLAARQDLRNVQVTYGAPLPAPSAEFIWLGDVDGDQEPAAIGAQRREETYRLAVICQAVRNGQDQQAATERAYELAAAVENTLRTDGTVGGTVRFAQVGGPFNLEEMANDTQRAAHLTVTVQVRARI